TKSLGEMSPAEWESLCDGSGKCCMCKLEDMDTGDIYLTSVACRMFDPVTCRCKDYANRQRLVADCVLLTPEKVQQIGWLPETCAYRLVAAGKDLEWWHPLVSGDAETVHRAGISMRGKVVAMETEMADEEAYLEYVLESEP